MASERERKSACFWLLPSSTTRSPGAIRRSRASTIRSLGNKFFRHDETRHALIGSRTGESYSLGDPVKVKVVEAAPVTGGLRFSIEEHESMRPVARREAIPGRPGKPGKFKKPKPGRFSAPKLPKEKKKRRR